MGSFDDTTGAAPAFDGVITSLPFLKFDGYTKDAFIQQCAMMILAYSDLDRNNINQLIDRAISSATLLAERLNLE